MAAYYNEIDPYAAQWLRNLIDAGHIAPGVVDERSIEDVLPDELAGFAQCHFFAGIGVWSLALRRAGWPDDRPVWTGSCPCQPFSSAGKGAGFDDERHLWPAFFHLIQERRPAIVLGEQVASSDVGPWLDLVQADLEGVGHTFGCVPFPSAGVGAPHIRDRLFWVADAGGNRLDQQRRIVGEQAGSRQRRNESDDSHSAGGLGNPERLSSGRHAGAGAGAEGRPALWPVRDDAGPSGAACGLGDHEREGLALGQRQPGVPGRSIGADAGQAAERAGVHAGRLADHNQERRGRRQGVSPRCLDDRTDAGRLEGDDGLVGIGEVGLQRLEPAGPTNGLWRAADWLLCRDGRWRPVEPGTFPLAHGAPARVGRLRAYGNAINAEAARVFIQAVMA